MLDEGSQGDEEFVPQTISFGSAGPDVAPAPVNDEGLIDGEWVSEVAATVFVNAGKAGSGHRQLGRRATVARPPASGA